MKSLAIRAVLVACVLTLSISGVASASHYLRLSTGTILHWKSNSTTSTSRTVRLYDDMLSTTTGERWRTWINSSRIDWDASARLSLPAGYFDSVATIDCPWSGTGVEVCNWSNYNGYGNNGALYAGLAEFLVVSSAGHISRGRVRLDDANSGASQPTWTCSDRFGGTTACENYARATACQELGHEFGLDHVGGSTCMGNGYFAASLGQLSPNTHDISAIDSSHNHSDTSAAAAASITSTAETSAPSSAAPSDRVIPIPPPGDCARRQVTAELFVERTCDLPQASPEDLRIIFVIPRPSMRPHP